MAGHAHGRTRLGRAVVPAVLVASLALSACEGDPDEVTPVGADVTPSRSAEGGSGGKDGGPVPTQSPSDAGSEEEDSPSTEASYAVEPPGPFKGLSRSDVLITATESLPDE